MPDPSRDSSEDAERREGLAITNPATFNAATLWDFFLHPVQTQSTMLEKRLRASAQAVAGQPIYNKLVYCTRN